MRAIQGSVKLSQSDVLQLPLSRVSGRYRRGNLTLTIYDVLDDSGDVVVCWPTRPSNDFSPFEWCRCTGWALVEHVIGGMFTLMIPDPLPEKVLLTEEQQRSVPVAFGRLQRTPAKTHHGRVY